MVMLSARTCESHLPVEFFLPVIRFLHSTIKICAKINKLKKLSGTQPTKKKVLLQYFIGRRNKNKNPPITNIESCEEVYTRHTPFDWLEQAVYNKLVS